MRTEIMDNFTSTTHPAAGQRTAMLYASVPANTLLAKVPTGGKIDQRRNATHTQANAPIHEHRAVTKAAPTVPHRGISTAYPIIANTIIGALSSSANRGGPAAFTSVIDTEIITKATAPKIRSANNVAAGSNA